MSGDACSLGGAETGLVTAQCTWGDDPRPECRTTGFCQQDHTWLVTTPDATVCSTPALPPECPTSPATVGTTCSDPTLSCWYEDGTTCFCSECNGGSEYPICQPISPPQWACRGRPPGCSADIPQAGTACDQEGTLCGPDCELEVICQNGVWVWRTGNCPICAAPDTPIATPEGERPIASLRIGDLVYSVDHDALVAVPVVATGNTPVVNHRVTRLTLESGRILEISPGHPTADGRRFGDLVAGNLLDSQNAITSANVVPYTHDRTYDILPASSTGTYVAAGAIVGSTMFHGAVASKTDTSIRGARKTSRRSESNQCRVP